jgi:hypothetical protein
MTRKTKKQVEKNILPRNTGEKELVKKKEWKDIIYGASISLLIIITFLAIISFLFLAERNPEEIIGPEEPEILITNRSYPDFFNNDKNHFPKGDDSVSGDRCLLCHDSTGNKVIFESSGFKLYNSTKSEFALKCFTCHIELKHKIQTPYNNCTECHYLDDHNSLSLSFNLILAEHGQINNEFCIECHEQECSELQKVGHTHEDICTSCHNDHKIIPGCLDCHDPSDVGPYHDLGTPEFEVCTDCHKGGAHTRPVINDEMDCSICHSDWYMINLENYGGKHFTNPNLGKCSSCHTAHKEYPTCRDCHGIFPEHKDNGVIQDPNHDCKICHKGGAHDNRVIYSNYNPDLGDEICEVCHESEYKIYYEKTTEGEREKYGNCLNCHEEHDAEIKIPHMVPENFQDCSACHEGYIGPKSMHVISNTSFESFPYTLVPNEFCSSCHASEYQAITENMTQDFLNNYGGCTNCHYDHKLIDYTHPIESPYDICENCHLSYQSSITIHNPRNITYENTSFEIGNEFCSPCHKEQNDRLSKGVHLKRGCTDCHGSHKKMLVDFNKCINCHETNIPSSHDETITSCYICHDTDVIHTTPR